MYTADIIPIIINKYDSFTKIEEIIADYFISNQEQVDFSIKAMKERLFVSEASLSRFAQKLGFRGYREFIYQYEQSFATDQTYQLAPLKVVMKSYEDILKSFSNNIDEDLICRISDMIASSEKILVVGIGSSGLAAEEMKQRFIRIGVSVESCDQTDLMKMRSLLQDETCLVIGISLSGLKEEILFTLKHAHQRNAKTVLISGCKYKSEYVDELLTLPALKNLDGGNLISPQFPILVGIDLIYNYFVYLNKNRKMLHKKTLEALERK